MWSKFNALFVDYPMGHFTVGLLGKGMVTIWCCIGANIKGLITKPLCFLGVWVGLMSECVLDGEHLC